MVQQVKPQDYDFVLKFGGGLNTRASEDAIKPEECSDGQNFDLDVDNNLFRRRKPFDLVATATNAEEIRGFVQLEKADGTLSTLVQAGGTVYEWDGSTGFTSVGTVKSSALLRGPRSANFPLDNVAIITDLNKAEPVKTWDGTTLADLAHNLADDFYAKYCRVDNERALFANVQSGTDTPHLFVGSTRSDYTTLSVNDRPSSSLSAADPFYIPMPDLKPVNGLEAALGRIVFSTRKGRIYQLTGSDATDFALDQLYPDSGAVGDETMAYIGNDIAYGRPGRIETLFATQLLGDVQTDDLTRRISPTVADVQSWQTVFNSRLQKIYFFDRDGSRVFVFHKNFLDEQARKIAAYQQESPISPWSLWKTDHAASFQTRCAMTLLRPTDGVEVTYIGGANGEIFQLEGDGGQDGGTTDVTADRTSFVISPPSDREFNSVEGYIAYRKTFPATVTLTFQLGGYGLRDETITIDLPQAENIPVYGGSFYYGGSAYYGIPFEGRFARQRLTPIGQAAQIQIKVSVAGSTDFSIKEIGLRFRAS